MTNSSPTPTPNSQKSLIFLIKNIESCWKQKGNYLQTDSVGLLCGKATDGKLQRQCQPHMYHGKIKSRSSQRRWVYTTKSHQTSEKSYTMEDT